MNKYLKEYIRTVDIEKNFSTSDDANASEQEENYRNFINMLDVQYLVLTKVKIESYWDEEYYMGIMRDLSNPNAKKLLGEKLREYQNN